MSLRARFQPGKNVPAKASAAIVAGTFVKISADKDSDGNYVIAHCVAGDRAFGVTEEDVTSTQISNENAHSVELLANIIRDGAIARVVPAATMSAATLVSSDANGKAVAATSGAYIVGATVEACTSTDAFVEVELFKGGLHA